MLFSSSIINEIEIIFTSCNGLNDAKQPLINSRLYKTLGVIYLSEIKNWGIIKGNSKRSKAIFFSHSKHQSTVSKHLAFGFITKNISYFFKFYFMLLDDKGNNIAFTKGEDKTPVLNFKIQIIK